MDLAVMLTGEKSDLGSQQRKGKIYDGALNFMTEYSPVKCHCLSYLLVQNETEYDISLVVKDILLITNFV